MTSLVETGLSNAVAAGVLAIVAVLVGAVCRRPALVHALWLLVLLKLVTPPLVPVHVPLPSRASAPEPAAVVEVTEPTPPVEEEAPVIDVVLVEDVPDAEEVVAAEVPEPAPAARPVTIPWADWPWWVGGVWVAGSVGWYALAGLRVWRFGRLLRFARPAPKGFVRRVARLAEEVGLEACPAVKFLPGNLAPMVWGARSPVLLLPEGLEDLVGEDGLDTLLLHELAHLRRWDNWVRVLEFVALGLYWWLPLAWYARRELREAEEQCCDAWVVCTRPRAGKLYATALVDALDFLATNPQPVPPLATGLGRVADLKRRLTMILRGSTPSGLSWSGVVVVLGLAAFLLPLVPSVSVGQSAPAKAEDVIVVEGFAIQDSDVAKLQAELEKQKEQLAALAARLADAKKKKAIELELGAVDRARKRAEDVRKEIRVEGKPLDPGDVIRIEIHGVTGGKKELDELLEKLEKVLPGKDRRIMITRDKDTPPRASRATAPMAPTQPRQPAQPPREVEGRRIELTVPAARNVPGVPMTPSAVTPAPGGSDKRLDNLERRLESILKELESLRREMRGPTRGRPGGGGREEEGEPARVSELPKRPTR